MRFRPLLFLFAIAFHLCGHRLSAATAIPFQYRDGMIWLKVAVAGQAESLNFLLDSGAGASVIDLATARRLGLRLGRSQSIQGVQGRGVAHRIDGFAGCVAGVEIPSSLLGVDLSAPGRACHRHIDGLLGDDFFRRHIVQIDFAAQKLRLLARSEVNPAGCESLPLSRRNDVLCARISVDGNAPEWLRLDTGCNSALEWVVSSNQARKLGGTTIGLNSRRPRAMCATVQLGARRIPDVKIGLHARPMFPGESGLIGNGLLSHFLVTIDSAKRRCLLASR